MVIRETGSSKLKHFRGVPAEDAHNIQTHINSLDLLVSRVPRSPGKFLKLPSGRLQIASKDSTSVNSSEREKLCSLDVMSNEHVDQRL